MMILSELPSLDILKEFRRFSWNYMRRAIYTRVYIADTIVSRVKLSGLTANLKTVNALIAEDQ